jgi:hypothetical protein
MYEFHPVEFSIRILAEPVIYIVLIAVLFSVAAKLVYREVKLLDVLGYYTFVSMPIGLTGFAAGTLTGMSRAPAVGTLIPAALALIGGMNVYIFGTDNRYKVVVGYSVCIFMLMLFIGIETGAFKREGQREPYFRLLSEQEFRIKTFRSNLSLPPDMPSWVRGDVK